MPAMTPVLARGPPSSRARIRLRRVPMTFSRTPRMLTVNSSTRVPSNIVRPTPIMPGRISSMPIRAVCAWAATSTVSPLSANRTAIVIRRSGIRLVAPGLGLTARDSDVSLFGLKCLLVKEKWAILRGNVDTADARLLESGLRGWSNADVILLSHHSGAAPDIGVRGGVAVVLVCDWRGIRLGLTCHRAKQFFQRASSARRVEGAFLFMPLLCVTVTAPTTAELRRKRDQAAADADIVELRLDSVKDPDVAAALAGRRGPVIVTCRPTWEGGRFGGAEEERRRILGDAIALGAEYVDIEWRAEFGDLLRQTGGRRIVLSFHDFDGVPNDLGERVQTMRASGAEVVKIAVKTRQLADCVPLIELGARMGQGGGYVAVGMGDCGLATRVLTGPFGSMWTYAGSEPQVGQLTTTTLLNDYHFRTLTDATDVYGLVGLPVSHSVSPAMHNAAFVAAEVDAVYLPFPTASAEDFFTFGRAKI